MGKEKVSIEIPTTWNDISIKMYNKFQRLKKRKGKLEDLEIYGYLKIDKKTNKLKIEKKN